MRRKNYDEDKRLSPRERIQKERRERDRKRQEAELNYYRSCWETESCDDVHDIRDWE